MIDGRELKASGVSASPVVVHCGISDMIIPLMFKLSTIDDRKMKGPGVSASPVNYPMETTPCTHGHVVIRGENSRDISKKL